MAKTNYVILAQRSSPDLGFDVVGFQEANSDEQAIRLQFPKGTDSPALVAVPERSWHPHVLKTKQRDPILLFEDATVVRPLKVEGTPE